MPAEKQNKIASALDGMDCIPEGFQFDQKRGWQKLQNSLPSNAKRKRRVLLYAAILIPAIVVVGLMIANSGDKKTQQVESVTQNQKLKEIEKEIQTASELTTTVTKSEILVKEKLAGRVEKQNAIIVKKENIVMLDSTPANNTVVVAEINLPDTTVAVAVTVTKPKPRFRIAHINELNENNSASNSATVNRPFKKPFLAQVNETPNDGSDKIVEKKKPIAFLPGLIQ